MKLREYLATLDEDARALNNARVDLLTLINNFKNKEWHEAHRRIALDQPLTRKFWHVEELAIHHTAVDFKVSRTDLEKSARESFDRAISKMGMPLSDIADSINYVASRIFPPKEE